MPKKPLAHLLAVVGSALLAIALAMTAGADDRDLLRFNTAKPYLFILLDTSGSMNLGLGGGNIPVEGHGDDPRSRIYAAKEALYTVFENVTDVNFGFAALNQDELLVRNKHYLYANTQSLPGSWPLSWPSSSDLMAFGRHFVDPVSGTAGVAGSCSQPLDLDTLQGRRMANAFAKLNTFWNYQTTTLFVESKNVTYRLSVSTPGGVSYGQSGLPVDFVLEVLAGCPSTVTAQYNLSTQLAFEREFLMIDRGVPGTSSGTNAAEWTANLWPNSDALDRATCGSPSPFTGKGWEGNYDGGITTGNASFDSLVTDVDEYCDSSGNCTDLRNNPTSVSPLGRTMDFGDVLPFSWLASNKDELLRRLAPNHGSGLPNFGVSEHLVGVSTLGRYVPAVASRPPLVARGDTPLAKAILDFRCWYLGTEGVQGNQKCRSSAFFNQGWSQTACTYDSEWGCRRPYLVVISDGADTCPGENPAADTAALNTHSGVKTWALNLGDPQACNNNSTGSLKSITTNGKGECINASNKQDLLDTLNDILGQIREETTAFASAAVPSVQATVDDAIYLTNFTPLQNKSVWDGHLNAFLKPLPMDSNGVPDTSAVCSSTLKSECFLWDAGDVMVNQQVPAGTKLGTSPSQRRVYYTQEPTSASWQGARRLLLPTDDTMPDRTRYDLWRAFGLTTAVDGSLTTAQEDALELASNAVVDQTFAVKSATVTATGQNVTYVLGDIFHSDPPGGHRAGKLPALRHRSQQQGRSLRSLQQHRPGIPLLLSQAPLPPQGRHRRQQRRYAASVQRRYLGQRGRSLRQRHRPRAHGLHAADRDADGREAGHRREPPL